MRFRGAGAESQRLLFPLTVRLSAVYRAEAGRIVPASVFWPRPKVASLVAPTVPPELDRLLQSLNLALGDLDVPVEDRTFRPHITVARHARPFETQRLAQRAVTEWSGFELVESVPVRGGVSYHVVDQ